MIKVLSFDVKKWKGKKRVTRLLKIGVAIALEYMDMVDYADCIYTC